MPFLRVHIIGWVYKDYFSFPREKVEEAEQHLLYDWNDVLNGIGGAMGLFLGFSLLSIADSLGDWLEGRGGKGKDTVDVEAEAEDKWAQEMGS